jgi:hypothetical protein
VRIYDFAQDERTACISMEYVNGETLSALRVERANKVFEVDELRPLVEQACDALEYAHVKAKIVHHDLKPSNLMLNSREELKVTDFGIARSLSDSVSMLTMRTSGTLVYMSPQQLDGERASPTDDIYSLGATVYELLTGRPPFYSGGIETQIRIKKPPSIAERRSALEVASPKAVPDEWEATIAACLAKEPAERPQSAGQIAKRLGLATLPYGRTTVSAAPAPAPPPPPVEPPRLTEPAPLPGRSLTFIALVIGLFVVAGSLLGYFGFFLPSATQRTSEESRAAETETKARNAERLRQSRGALIVNTEPHGATITLGNQIRKSPASFTDVSIGTARVKIFLDGYEPIERDFEISENKISDSGLLRLVRILGAARIESTPPSIEFDLIDADGGHHGGTTPASLSNIPTGSAEVIFKPAGASSHRERISISASSTASSTWRMPEAPSPKPLSPPATTAPPLVAPDTAVAITPNWQVNPLTTPAQQEILGEFTYKGMVGPYEATFRLKFEPGERVSGTYTMPVNKGLVLRLAGSNPKGKMYLEEYTHDKLSAHIELTLSLTATEIRWEGTMYNTPPDNRVFSVKFTRPR